MVFTWTAYAGSGDMASLGMAMTMYGALPVAALPGAWNTAVQSGAAAHDATITTQAASSLVLAATVDSSAAATPNGTTTSGSVTVDQVVRDTANTGAYTAQSVVSSAAGAAVKLGVSEAHAGGVALLEVPLSAAPAGNPCLGYSSSVGDDPTSTASGLPWSFPGASGSEVINTSSLGTGQYFFVAVSAMGSPTGGQVAMTLTDTYGLVWTELAAANTAGSNYAGIWMGFNPAGPLQSLPSYTLARCVQNRPYQTSLRNPGGWAPIVWRVATGSHMPGGLYLEPSGLVYGQIYNPGSYQFRATATDQLGNEATTDLLTVTVYPSPYYGAS